MEMAPRPVLLLSPGFAVTMVSCRAKKEGGVSGTPPSAGWSRPCGISWASTWAFLCIHSLAGPCAINY